MASNQRAFLSGPMRGRADFNFELFDHVTLRLFGAGYDVFNPAEHARKVLGPLEKIQRMSPEALRKATRGLMAYNAHWICTRAEILFQLPDWARSLGAQAEYNLAVACEEIQIMPVPNIMLPWEKVKDGTN